MKDILDVIGEFVNTVLNINLTVWLVIIGILMLNNLLMTGSLLG